MRQAFLPILIATCLAAAPARAAAVDHDVAGPTTQKKALAQKLYQRALDLYLAKKYKEAASELRRAYAHAKLPPILYRLGLTYRELGQAGAARAAFEEYLAAWPQAPNRAEV